MIDLDRASDHGLTPQQAEIVNLIERRFNRAAIAVYLGVSTQVVRDVIAGLCEHYDCPGRDLPAAVQGSKQPDPSAFKTREEDDDDAKIRVG